MLTQIEQTLRSHPFVTPKLLQSTHVQTLLPGIFPSFKTKLPPSEKIFISLPDGSQILTNCWWQKNKERHATIILIGGLDGYMYNERNPFAEQLSNKSYYFGFNVIYLKQRAEGDTIQLTKSLFGAYPVDDIELALEKFISWGLKKFYFVGNSGGGWVILYTISKLKPMLKKYVLGIVSIDAPINFLSAWDHVRNNTLYKRILLYFYKNLVRRRIKNDPKGTWDIKQLNSIASLREWGDAYIHTSNKFLTVDEYHEQTDLTTLLPQLTVPTLIIHAKDDPIIPVAPFMKLRNPWIVTLFPEHGGHCGFITTKRLYNDLDCRWAQNRAMEFIRLLENKK